MNKELQKLKAENEKLKKILSHFFAEVNGYYFISGEGGEVDSLGLPDTILICPTYGAEGFCVYKKFGEYTAPGW